MFFAVFVILVTSGQRGKDALFSNLALTKPMLLARVSAISTLMTGIVGIVKNRERSVLVFPATVIGFYLLILSLGEILVPH